VQGLQGLQGLGMGHAVRCVLFLFVVWLATF